MHYDCSTKEIRLGNQIIGCFRARVECNLIPDAPNPGILKFPLITSCYFINFILTTFTTFITPQSEQSKQDRRSNMAGSDFFSVPIFFIIFRECLEAAIIVSVLLSFIHRSTGPTALVPNAVVCKRLVRQVWFGATAGLLICFIIGGAFIGAFYKLQQNIWGQSEEIWEGTFSLIACILITFMGLAMLRVNKLQGKWTTKLADSMGSNKTSTSQVGQPKRPRFSLASFSKRYALFILPFVTVLREGLEGIVFVGGVGLSTPAKAFPIPVISGLLSGAIIGYFIYRGGNILRLEWFLIGSTWVLYLVAAGLFSKSIGFFETYAWNKMTGGEASEYGAGPGSYNIKWTVFHVNYGSPDVSTTNGSWLIFNSVLGWRNTGSYGTVLGYALYWIAIILALVYMRFQERNPNHRFSLARFSKKNRNAKTTAGVGIGKVQKTRSLDSGSTSDSIGDRERESQIEKKVVMTRVYPASPMSID